MPEIYICVKYFFHFSKKNLIASATQSKKVDDLLRHPDDKKPSQSPDDRKDRRRY